MTDLGQQPDAPEENAAPPPVGLVTFFVAGVEYGVPVARVHEVVRVETITRVPLAPPHVRGLTTHRGRMIPVIDLAAVLGQGPAIIGPHARMVAVEIATRIVGLLVDRTAAVSWHGHEIRVLDLDRLLEAP
jgi:purine-binding chemotaxis protein CheW